MSLAKLIEEKRKAKSRKEKTKTTKNIAVGAAAGILAGLAGGILFAPKAGKETRESIKESATDLTEAAKDKTIEAKNKVAQYIKDKKDEKARLEAAIDEDNKTATIEDVLV